MRDASPGKGHVYIDVLCVHCVFLQIFGCFCAFPHSTIAETPGESMVVSCDNCVQDALLHEGQVCAHSRAPHVESVLVLLDIQPFCLLRIGSGSEA